MYIIISFIQNTKKSYLLFHDRLFQLSFNMMHIGVENIIRPPTSGKRMEETNHHVNFK